MFLAITSPKIWFFWTENILTSIGLFNFGAYFLGVPITSIVQIALPSTLLTSIWVVLFFVSIIFLKLLTPLEYLRRFTLWWFKDIDAHPLRAIAKVAATLIVVGAFALKAARWGVSVL
jgi:hypothetical protein